MMKRVLPILFAFFLFTNLSQAQTIPDFTLTDLDGKEHNLYDILRSGKTVVLDFFASWCGPCAFSSVELEDFYEANGEGSDRLEILSITIEPGDSPEVINDLFWGGHYPTFSYEAENDNQFNYYANNLGFNPDNAIPFFVFICPNVDDPGNSEIIKNNVGYNGGMFTFQYQLSLNNCVASLPPTSVNELETVEAFTLFPNPATDELNLAFYLHEGMDSELVIYNTLGQVVQRVDKQTYLAGENVHQIDISELVNGMYVLAYETAEGRVTETFNVTR